MDERTKWALYATREHAGRSRIGLLHLLWGLLRDKENTVSQILMSRGVTPEQVDAAIGDQVTRKLLKQNTD
jgi:hypothetical protein